MGFYDVANHWLIYVMVAVGISFVAGLAIISMRKSWRRALQIGYTKNQLMTVVKSSISFTIVPSIAIVVGLFSLAAMLGIPWPWWRLSVVGAVTYETMAAQMALSAAGVDLANATATEFVLVMYVMSIGIMTGIVVSPFISKRIQQGTMQLKARDAKWGALGNSVFMMVIMVVFMVPMLLDFSSKGIVTLLTLVTSVGLAFGLSVVINKFKVDWLRSFVLAICLLAAMASSVLWTSLIGA